MKVEHGDILLFHSHGFLSRAIQFFMNMWRWVNFKYTPFYANVPNHVAMGVDHNAIVEAIESGVVVSPINCNRLKKSDKTIQVYRYPWSVRQHEALDIFFNEVEGTPYQFINFFQYIVYILSFGKLWIGKKQSESLKKIYCSELAATAIFRATTFGLRKTDLDNDAHTYFWDPWKINPLQMKEWVSKHCELVTTYVIKDGIVTEILS